MWTNFDLKLFFFTLLLLQTNTHRYTIIMLGFFSFHLNLIQNYFGNFLGSTAYIKCGGGGGVSRIIIKALEHSYFTNEIFTFYTTYVFKKRAQFKSPQ